MRQGTSEWDFGTVNAEQELTFYWSTGQMNVTDELLDERILDPHFSRGSRRAVEVEFVVQGWWIRLEFPKEDWERSDGFRESLNLFVLR